jgi:peptide-methionine (S)-S-oxide reductase
MSNSEGSDYSEVNEQTERATVAGGCFWCIEAAFKELSGVHSVTSGYCGGTTEYPTYEEVCSGSTGHAEAVQVTYDSDEIQYDEILEVFFKVHDPTTRNRQGPDVGSQYRSAIYYHDEDQQEIAEAFIEELEASDAYDDPVVTEVAPLEAFYEAEKHHQDFYEKNPNNSYCVVNVNPKIEKVREQFGEKIET